MRSFIVNFQYPSKCKGETLETDRITSSYVEAEDKESACAVLWKYLTTHQVWIGDQEYNFSNQTDNFVCESIEIPEIPCDCPYIGANGTFEPAKADQQVVRVTPYKKNT